MKRFTGILLICSILCSLVAPQVAFAQAGPPTVVDVQVTGFHNASPEDQKKVNDIITPLKGKPFDQKTVDQASADIEDIGVFFRASVVQTAVEGGVKLAFTVIENKVISRVQFTGNVSFTSEQLLALMKNKPGQVYNNKYAVEDYQAIQNAYKKAGYVFSQISHPEQVPDEADPLNKVVLTFEIFEPRISEIRINGAHKTREYVIRRYLDFKIGDILNQNTRQASLRDLTQLGIFEDVTIVPTPGTLPSTYVMNVNVVERSTGTASLGLTEDQVEGLGGFVSVAENNLFGTGQRISANVRIGGERGYQFSYTNPWISPNRTGVTVNLYNFTTLREAFLGNSNAGIDYYERRGGGDVTFSRPLGQFSRVNYGFRVNTIKATESTTITDPTIRSLLLTDSRVNSVTLGFTRDSRNYPLNPYAGSYSSLSTEIAGLGGASFMKASAETRRYFVVKEDKSAKEREANTEVNNRLPRHWIYATRLVAGASTGVPPFLDQFFVGGSETNTLRGFKQDRFPGEDMVLWNNELRVPLNDTLSVVGFVDAGDAWHGQAAELLGDRTFKLHYGYGLGLRLMLPAIGPLRLDYGINDQGNSAFTFAFGPTF